MPTWRDLLERIMSVKKVVEPCLTPDEAAAAYLAKTPMEFSARANRVEYGGNGEGWIDVNKMLASFWQNFASGRFDFRLKPRHVYKRADHEVGDVVRVRKVRNGEKRKHAAFFLTDSAFFAIVQGPHGPEAEGDFYLLAGDDTTQVTHVSDFEPVNIE